MLDLSDSVRIEPITTVSTQELWSTAPPETVASGSVVVEHLPIDVESATVKGQWHACALILVGTTDVGIKPVAVRVWTSQPCDSSISLRASAAPSETAFRLKVTTNQTFDITVTEEEKVSIAGKPLGSIGY